METPQHERHKAPTTLERPRELLLVCPPLRSNVNLSRIVRAASCFGMTRMIACGQARIDQRIARDGADQIAIEVHRTLAPVLGKLRRDGYRLVGLEQATQSVSIYQYRFVPQTALVLGNERHGIADDILCELDDIVEIPVYGLPFSHNVGTAAAVAMYEYCRQMDGRGAAK